MASKTKSELIANAIELEIELKGDETVAQLEELIDTAGDKEVAELQKQAAQSKPEKKESFSREEVIKMIEENNKKIRSEMKNVEEDEDPFKVQEFKNPIVRVARVKNKFVVGFKNLNEDDYNPDLVVHSNNIPIKNPTTGRVEAQPFVTLIFSDGTVEENYPLLSLMDRARAVQCEVIETKKSDTSYAQGFVTEKSEAEGGYDLVEGRKIRAKVTQFKNEYVVREPKNGETFTVQEEVINLVS